DLEGDQARGEGRVREAGGETAADDRDHARGSEGARGGLTARAAAEVLACNQDVAGAETTGECRVEVGEELPGGVARRECGEARRQDVGGREIVAEAPGAARQHRQPRLASRVRHRPAGPTTLAQGTR